MKFTYLSTAFVLALFLVNPSKAEEKTSEYDQAKKALSADKQAVLDQLDKNVVSTFDPKYSIQIMDNDYQACLDYNENFSKNKPLVQNHHYLKKREHFTYKKQLDKQISEIDFIDQNILFKHLNMSIGLQHALVKGISEAAILARKDSNNGIGDYCNELETKLEKEYAGNYIQHTNYDPKFNYREVKQYNIKNCGFQFVSTNENKDFISAAFIFSTPDDSFVFDTSATIQNSEKKRLPIKNFWIDFGELDSRANAKYGSPYPELLIANFPKEKIIPALEQMMERPALMGVETDSWGKEIVFTNNKIPQEELQKMARCIAKIDPSLESAVQNSSLFAEDRPAIE